MTKLETVAAIIAALGGNRAVAGRLKLGESAVSMWRVRGISRRYRPDIKRALDRRGLAYDPGLVWVDTQRDRARAIAKYHAIIDKVRKAGGSRGRRRRRA